MEETKTIKGKEVIAYKGMNYDMTCRDFKYEVGETYKTDKAERYECGFHACLNPIDVFEYYSEERKSRYFKVLLSGEIANCDNFDTPVAATEITILEEINIKEVIETTEWWKHENVIDLLYFSDGFARVRRKDKWNFIDTKGNYLSDEWFDWVDNFQEGFAIVNRGDDKWNFIDKNGNYLSNDRFVWVGNFLNGFAIVRRDDTLYNLIGTNGNYLFDEWFKSVDYFSDGFARVQRTNDEWNFIDTNGKYLSKEWFKWMGDSDEYDLAIVERKNGELCKIDKTGKLIKIDNRIWKRFI